MRIIFGTNHRGAAVREILLGQLHQREDEIVDCGVFDATPVDYPEIAIQVAREVSLGKADRGVLVSGMGFGMVIAANKFPGVRAVLCHDEIAAEISRRYCDCNVLCLSSDLTAPEMLRRIIDTWLASPFDGGRHARRLSCIGRLEDETMKKQP